MWGQRVGATPSVDGVFDEHVIVRERQCWGESRSTLTFHERITETEVLVPAS